MGATLGAARADLHLAVRPRAGGAAARPGGLAFGVRIVIRSLAAVTVGVLVACESFTEVIGPTPFGATLAGADVRPVAVTTTNGKGTLTASLHPYDVALSYTLSWSDLGSGSVPGLPVYCGYGNSFCY